MMSTRPSRQAACVQGEKEAAPGWRAAPRAPSCRAHTARLSPPSPGFLRPVPVSGPGCQHPPDLPAVHVPGPDPAHRVVGRLALHPVCPLQAGAGAGLRPEARTPPVPERSPREGPRPVPCRSGRRGSTAQRPLIVRS